MSNTSANVRNYFKLELLIARSYVLLRQSFKNRYFLFTGGQLWDDSPTCGSNYSVNVIGKSKKLNLTSIQKTSVLNGDSNEWDLTTLTALLLNADRPKHLNTIQIQQLDNEDAFLIELRDIRNTLAHHKSKNITDTEFNQIWSKLKIILLTLGDDNNELDKIKDDSIFDPSIQSINEENVKEALRLNSLGSRSHKEHRYSDAITLFTKAIVLPGVPNRERAIIYSNLSSSRLALYEEEDLIHSLDINNPNDQRYRALQDAKQARNISSTWWKGHFRVGKVYVVLNEHEKAIQSFERALALDPANGEIQKALDESRQVHGRQLRHEHLDPRLKPRTMPEQLNELNQKLGVDPQNVRLVHSMLEKVDPPGADVVRGHKYEHGDIDVKQDYEQAAKYFAKAAGQGNAEGIYNLARLYDRGLGVKKDHNMAFKLLEQAAAQPPQHPKLKHLPNLGVAEAEHSLGLRYMEGVVVHKNLSIAAYWYQRAVDHGSAQSANNLALLYQDGTGVEKNLEKAEKLFELSARRGDPNAMLNLAELLMNKDDFEMSKIWYDRACEAGNVLAQTDRVNFESILHRKQQLRNSCPSDILQSINKMKKLFDSVDINNTPNELSNDPDIYDYNLLNQYANNGSLTARKMCNALTHFAKALDILSQSQFLTEEQENRFIHELAQCYRIDRVVAKIPTIEIHQKIEGIINRILQRCNVESNTSVSQLDEDVRMCYATLHIDSHQLILQFLESCKQKYPKSIYFLDLSAFIHCSLGNYEDSLYNINIGLRLDTINCELLYQKAFTLTLLNDDIDKIIEAYQTFLSVVPKDHPEVPESYYAMAMCYLVCQRSTTLVDIAKDTYEQGKEAEQIQLPCFLPYESKSKTVVKRLIDMECSSNTEVTPVVQLKTHLTNPHRVEVIKTHRKWEADIIKMKKNSKNTLLTNTKKARVKQQTAKSLIGLKSISLREINPTKDHVYSGYVLSVKIIEKAYSWNPSIHLVIEDENLHCERMAIYGFPESQGEYLINDVFIIGSKMNIINPYLRLGANDMKPSIRVDDFSSIIMQGESERVINMCRSCGQSDAPHVCAICKQARYCSKECQTIDWKFYQHKLICKI